MVVVVDRRSTPRRRARQRITVPPAIPTPFLHCSPLFRCQCSTPRACFRESPPTCRTLKDGGTGSSSRRSSSGRISAALLRPTMENIYSSDGGPAAAAAAAQNRTMMMATFDTIDALVLLLFVDGWDLGRGVWLTSFQHRSDHFTLFFIGSNSNLFVVYTSTYVLYLSLVWILL